MSLGVNSGISPTVAAFVTIIVVVVAGGAYLAIANNGPAGRTSSTTSGSVIQGVVTGYVTVGPAQPVCRANQSCNVDMTGYSLVFTPTCSGTTNACSHLLAPLSPSGHYSILLSPGNYFVTGLSPSCTWLGCSTAFPKSVTVVGGMQIVVDIGIDTGIR